MRFTTRMVGLVFYVSVEGKVDDAEGACETYGAALRLCWDGGCERMLLDVRGVEGDPSLFERYDFASCVARQNTALLVDEDAAMRVALVGTVPLIDPGRFGEMVATNRGARVKVVTDVDEAFRWFGISPPADPSGDNA